MKGKYFIDTNIFVYSFDKNAGEKKKRSIEIISKALEESKGIISNQVIQEFLNVATRKFTKPLSIEDCHKYLTQILNPLCAVYSDIELYQQALDVMQRWKYSFYDSLIIASAMRAECKVLYSEDLQHRQRINSLKILNPFI